MTQKITNIFINYWPDKKNNALFWVRKENFENSLDDEKIDKVIIQ